MTTNEPIQVAVLRTVKPDHEKEFDAVFNAFVVALLTWVVMPVITRALHGWLQPKQEKNPNA